MATPKTEQGIYTAVVLDFETGGLDCTRCACTQIAMQAVRLDTFEVLGRYANYIAPYDKQPLGGAPKRKVLKTRREIEQESASEPMDYEATALNYTDITMDLLRTRGIPLKQVAAEIIDSYGEVTVTASEDDPTVCLVEFSFAVAHGLNQIYLTVHITV